MTRVDACADFDAQGPLKPSWRHPSRSRRSAASWAAKLAWDDFPEKGRTLYLGSQSSPVRMRLYEKGLQPEYAHLNRPNWGPH